MADIPTPMSSKCSRGSMKIVEKDCKANRSLGGLLLSDVAEKLYFIVFSASRTRQLPGKHYASIKSNSTTIVR